MKRTTKWYCWCTRFHSKFAPRKRIQVKSVTAISTKHRLCVPHHSRSEWERPFEGTSKCSIRGSAAQRWTVRADIFSQHRTYLLKQVYAVVEALQTHWSTKKHTTHRESAKHIWFNNVEESADNYEVYVSCRRCIERVMSPSFMEPHLQRWRRAYRHKNRG